MARRSFALPALGTCHGWIALRNEGAALQRGAVTEGFIDSTLAPYIASGPSQQLGRT